MIDLFVVHGYECLCSSAAWDTLNDNINLHSDKSQQSNWHLSWRKETDCLSLWFDTLHLLSKRKRRRVCANHADVTLHHVDVCYCAYNDMMCTKQVLCHTVCATHIKSDTESLKEKARKCPLVYLNVNAKTED